jgi:hypothetical protein
VHLTVKITAGRSGLVLSQPGALQILPVNDYGKNPWSSPESPEYLHPGSSFQPESPPSLQPGQSVCVVQGFDDEANPQQSPLSVTGWAVTLTSPNGGSQTVTLVDGGGEGSDCDSADPARPGPAGAARRAGQRGLTTVVLADAVKWLSPL